MLSIPKLIFKRPISFGEKSNLILKWLRMRTNQLLFGYSFVTHQKVKFKVRSNHYQLINYLFAEEQHIYPYLIKLLTPQSLLVDIGANIGLVSLPLTAATGCKTVAFEPARKTFLKLCENIFSNPHLEVFPLNVALSSHIFSGNITDTDSSGINQLQDDAKANTAPCLGFTLDSIAQAILELNVERFVIKIDVERHELDVLKGGGKILSAELPIFICLEFFSEENLQEITSLLCQFNFVPIAFDNEGRIIKNQRIADHSNALFANPLAIANFSH